MLPVDKMRVEFSRARYGEVERYIYSPSGTTGERVYTPQQCQHIFIQHPFDPGEALSPTMAARNSVLLMDILNVKLVKMVEDGGIMKVLMTPKTPFNDPKTREMFQELLRQTATKQFGFINVEADVHEFGIKPFETASKEIKADARIEIASGYGVSPILLGDPQSSTHENYKEAQQQLYRHTILPMARLVADGLNHWLSGKFSGHKLAVNVNEIEALQRDAKSVAEVQVMQVTHGIKTVDEVREDNGDGPVPGGDRARFPLNSDYLDATEETPSNFEPEI